MRLVNTIKWLDYWNKAHMVAVNEIRSLADMRVARSFCSCMSRGIFWDVTDEEMWAALQEYRAA